MSTMPIRYSYSGADCKAVAYFDDDSDYSNVADKNIRLEGLATISYSIHEAKSPVRRLGERSVAGYTKGIRTIAGSMVFLVIEDHPLASLVKTNNKTYAYSTDNDTKGVSFKKIQNQNRYVSTMLKPFNIGLFYKTEVAFTGNKNTGKYEHAMKSTFNDMAHLVISGVEIISEGMVTSVNDMVTEITMQFVAHDVFNIERQEEGSALAETEAKQEKAKPKPKLQPRAANPQATRPSLEPETASPQVANTEENTRQEVISTTSTEEAWSADSHALNFMGPPILPNYGNYHYPGRAPWVDYIPESWKDR